eukprot:364906-Chlamydomonas_euryale.AAC.14
MGCVDDVSNVALESTIGQMLWEYLVDVHECIMEPAWLATAARKPALWKMGEHVWAFPNVRVGEGGP